MSYNFEKLIVWQEARLFVKEIYDVVADFPKDERFVLGDQIRRAAISIVLNISEGADKKSNQDFIRFLRISLGSINETATCIYLAKDLGYIEEEKFNFIYNYCHKLSAMINALVKKLSAK